MYSHPLMSILEVTSSRARAFPWATQKPSSQLYFLVAGNHANGIVFLWSYLYGYEVHGPVKDLHCVIDNL